ncbi:MAG: 30S ribosomal protein S1 [Myxococcales bacterium]|nr:30S ribosomal protein S1 [Myxococcales bacterium]MCB9708554.1 30S ribosomal protein S1 [Myxococcales bacterium]
MTPTSDHAHPAPPGGESFASLFERTAAAADALREGEIVKGTVVQVNKDAVVVDIGFKSEGVIPLVEFEGPSGEVRVQAGDQVDVLVEATENDDGLVLLSKEKADKLRVWDEISEACERDELIEGTITARVKGGLSVTIRGGVKAFLPGSQVDLRPIRNLDKLLGETHQFKVIKFNKKRGNIVLSRRALLESERNALKEQTLQQLEEGMVVTGLIKNITEYGAFVDLGGIDGLLHITDMSWGRINHPSEVFNVGDQVEVKVLKYNPETERVSLGLKQTTEDPWLHAIESYPPGKRITGKVVSVTDYGAFVQIEEGIEGLIHVSEMSWGKAKHPSKLLEAGSELECQVLEVDADNKRISLGLKQLAPDPWNEFVKRYSPGDIMHGNVVSVTEYGVFVGIEDGVDGMVHKSDLSWTQRIENPAELYHKGDEVQAIILSVNHDERKVSLGIKQLYEDPWAQVQSDYPQGTSLEVRVLSISDSGVYVELQRGIEGFIPLAEMSTESVTDASTVVKEGDIVKARIYEVDSEQRRILLSLIDIDESHLVKFLENAAPKLVPQSPKSRPGATLGDVLKDQLGGKVEELSKP